MSLNQSFLSCLSLTGHIQDNEWLNDWMNELINELINKWLTKWINYYDNYSVLIWYGMV